MIYIPDVHGRPFWKKVVEQREENETVVFLGDYLEPYGYEGITHQDAYEMFLEVLQYKKEHMNDTVLLLGNHDFACIDRDMISCRHDYENHERNRKLFVDNLDLFDIGHKYELNGTTYIATHAGIHKEWIKLFKEYTRLQFEDENIIEFLNKMLHEDYVKILPGLGVVGRSRGGYDYYGSCVWADVTEHYHKPSSKLFDNTFQVFGHTQLKENAFICSDFACLDCRQGFRLTDKGEFVQL